MESAKYTIKEAVQAIQELDCGEDTCNINQYIKKRMQNNEISEIINMEKQDILPAVYRNKTFGRSKKGADNKGATKRAQNKKVAEQKGRRAKRAKNKKGKEQKGRKITMLRHRYIQGRNFFR